MDCREAQERILESLAAPGAEAHADDLDRHLAECESCRRFYEMQRQLDVQLSRAVSAPPLNPRFRKLVMDRVRREPSQVWPEFLPDKAHVVGCLCAIALSIQILPFPPGSTLLVALAFTLVTYVGQSVTRSLLETLEEGQQ